jgi:3'-5' exoribonuclease
MKSPFINELEVNKPITASFLVQSKEVREKKSGEPYLSLILGDKSGKMDSKMWDNVVEVLDTFDRDDFVKVKGIVQLHLNRPQFIIHKIRALTDNEVDFADFFPASLRNPDEMWTELRGIVAGVKNPHLSGLLNAILDDPEIARRFRMAPAAKSIHHAFLGGLLEHVLSLCALCLKTAAHYPFIDLDLMISGAVLHDIGKIYELSYDRGFNYTTEGQLLGHIMIAIRLIGDKLHGVPSFPVPLRNLLEHIVISHHGKLEFGSPKLPQFPEAILLHYLDDMDSKMESMRALIEADRQSGADFTTYNPALERTILKKEQYLEPKQVATSTPEPPKAPAPAPTTVPKPGSPFGEKLQLALVSDEHS